MTTSREFLAPGVTKGAAFSFADLCEHGGHFCLGCHHYIHPIESDHGEPRLCPQCFSVQIRWDPPVPGFRASARPLSLSQLATILTLPQPA